MYPFPECDKSVEILEEFTEPDSQSNTSSIVGKLGKQLNIQSQEIIDEEMTDADDMENKDNDSKDKSIVIVKGSQKRPIEVDTEETNTMQDTSPIKKAKKEVKNEDSQMLKRLIKELTSNSPHVSEISKEAVSGSSEDLLYLYNNITNSELRKEITSREVIRSYFLFGKAISQRFEYYYEKSCNLHQAQIDVNDELKEKLPDASENACNKRKKRAQKIYFLFSSIDIEKIELVKSFSADSISKLSVEKIKYIKDEIMKTAPQIMRPWQDIELLKSKSYDKGKASQQSNVTIGNDDDDVEFMQELGLIAEKDSSSVSDRGTSPIANNPVTTQEQATSPIANNSLSTQEQATNPITNEKGNLVQVNSTNQSDINDTVIQDQSTDEGGDTTNAQNRTSRQASPKIAREQDKLLGLIRELSSPVEGETAEIKKGESENSLARLYQKALKAENRVTQAYQEEIRCWYYYAEEFEKKVMSIRDNDRRIGDQQARTKVYDEIRDHLSGITKDTLRKKTQRARAIYNLFKKIGVEKIKRVHSYSADAIASLTVSQMQTIIDRVTNSLPIA
ncbi:hypothetical protein Glove_131g93 [Diversispora epigaea]|uniref:Uncharacterized protein n=1 Tax=Diversispora epigaea TaxID=1348612 RepID=A0A397IXU0_9GLOM|nr:hypothetical protein Glove_131g93 [Diversispora epigaea]